MSTRAAPQSASSNPNAKFFLPSRPATWPQEKRAEELLNAIHVALCASRVRLHFGKHVDERQLRDLLHAFSDFEKYSTELALHQPHAVYRLSDWMAAAYLRVKDDTRQFLVDAHAHGVFSPYLNTLEQFAMTLDALSVKVREGKEALPPELDRAIPSHFYRFALLNERMGDF